MRQNPLMRDNYMVQGVINMMMAEDLTDRCKILTAKYLTPISPDLKLEVTTNFSRVEPMYEVSVTRMTDSDGVSFTVIELDKKEKVMTKLNEIEWLLEQKRLGRRLKISIEKDVVYGIRPQAALYNLRYLFTGEYK